MQLIMFMSPYFLSNISDLDKTRSLDSVAHLQRDVTLMHAARPVPSQHCSLIYSEMLH